MLKKFILAIFSLISITNSMGQNIDFKLQDYQLADVKFRSFNNSLDLGSNGDNDFSLKEDTLLGKYSTSTFNYSANVLVYTNTRKRQSLLSLSAIANGYRRKDQNANTEFGRTYNWSLNTIGSYNNRFYLKPLVFIEVEPTVSYNFYQYNRFRKSKTANTETQDTENKPFLQLRLPIKVGYGRLERVEDARQSLFLVKQLKKSNRLSRDLSKQDMIKLSGFISKLRNKRFFDNRLQRIYQLKMIDSFYQVNDFSDVLDATYYTTTMDYWMFGGSPIRQNGSRVSLAIYTGTGQQKSAVMNAATGSFYRRSTTTLINQVVIGPEYIVDKPLSEAWQSTTSIRVYKGQRTTNNVSTFVGYESFDSSTYKWNQLFLSQTIGYYPTTRTWLTLSQEFSVIRLKDIVADIGIYEPPFLPSVDDFQTSSYRANLDYNYYISPRFRLNIRLSYTHLRTPDLREDDYLKQYSRALQLPASFMDGSGDLSPDNYSYFYNQKNNRFNAFIRVTYAIF